MRSHLYILLASVVFVSCQYNPKANDKRMYAADSITEIINQKTKIINDYFSVFVEIENNLDSINRKYQNILLKAGNRGELNIALRDEINSDIIAISRLMDKNRTQIIDLKNKLKKSEQNNKDLKTAISILNKQLSEKTDELQKMTYDLDDQKLALKELQLSLTYFVVKDYMQEETIGEETDALHRAYYITGTSSELLKNNVIDKQGGLLGLGKTAQLKNNFDNKRFTCIDIYNTYTIPVNSRKVKLITNHSPASYEMKKSGDTIKNIVITNPEEFWSASKYLVVVKK